MPESSPNPLIDTLRRPGVLEPDGKVAELLETHISWVLLTEHYAFKLKKPLDLGFLDFSTLEKRHQACLDELRLNQRLAPDLYLKVVSVTGTSLAPELDGSGEVLEYAVMMRRFEQQQLLAHRLEENRVTPALVDILIEEVAGFHRSLPASGIDSPWGTSEAVWAPVAENFQQIHPTPLHLNHEQELAELLAWSEQEHRRKRQTFEQRKQDGFIRECHGDMHPGNMVEIDQQVVVFDCLEFNAALRWIDTFSELAFLVMDLADRGANHFAFRLLNGYLQITGDYGGLEVLRFYLVYRAMVRAKVNAIRCQQEHVQGLDHRPALGEATGYLQLARGYTHPPRPYIAITFGLSGSGKTTYTQALLERTGAVRIRSDIERKRLAGLAPRTKSRSALDTGLYSSNSTETTYAHLLELCRMIANEGWPVIVDATFLAASSCLPFQRLAEAMSLPFAILEFRAAETILEQRILSRETAGIDASEATLEVLRRQQKRLEPPQRHEKDRGMIVDTEKESADGGWIDRFTELIRH